MAAGGAGRVLTGGLAGKTGDHLVPYVKAPQSLLAGEYSYYATTCRECPAGCGMHVRCAWGRALKAEGNAEHPINRGGLCARGQSAVQGLYDPDRLPGPLRRQGDEAARPLRWKAAVEGAAADLGSAGGRVAVLSDLQTGALAEVLGAFAHAFGSDRVLIYEPYACDALRQAHGMLFGGKRVPRYDLERCELVISFAADFLETWLSPVELAWQFAEMHAYRGGRLGRLAYVGPRLSMTATNADEMLRVPAGAERWVAVAMVEAIIRNGWARRDVGAARGAVEEWLAGSATPGGVDPAGVEDLARRFVEAESSVALAGPTGPASPAAAGTAAAVALLNWSAGRMGDTVDLSRPHALSGTAMADEMDAFFDALGPQDVLVVHNANPAFTRPAVRERVRSAGHVIYLGTMPDETAELADWVLPVHSPLESWGDYEPRTGTHCLMQPTMRPAFDTRQAGDVLMQLARAAGRPLARPDGKPAPETFREWLHERWDALREESAPDQGTDEFWRGCLLRGGYWEEPPPAEVTLRPEAAGAALGQPYSGPPADRAGPDLWLWPSIIFYDGRLANRRWLQESPHPMSFVVWGSWLDVHPRRAAELGLEDGDVVEVTNDAGSVEVPVRITEDVHEDVVAMAFGQGHTALGDTARGVGANAFTLLGGDARQRPFGSVDLTRTGRRHPLVRTAVTRRQHGRDVMQWVGLGELAQMHPGEGDELRMPLPEGYEPGKDIYPPHEYKEHRWAMVVDLQRCIGCGACSVACYAENNLAVNGPVHLAKGREMAWLKVVPYEHPRDSARLGWLPMLCQQCDAAPCESVCPVFAAVHNGEGLNAQVYNRCIGTRYCSNNCPYKVRRFNWVDGQWPEPLDWQLNPDVTVRSRGVMEKCTFCIQRIRRAEQRAKTEGRSLRDGEVVPACAQSCPTGVYTFGDLIDQSSRVSRLIRSDPRRYQVLKELNTKPAVIYLRRILA